MFKLLGALVVLVGLVTCGLGVWVLLTPASQISQVTAVNMSVPEWQTQSRQYATPDHSTRLIIKELTIKDTITLPVIMYHHILGWEGVEQDQIERGLRISPGVFEEHLKYLQKSGYTTITTKELYAYATGQLEELPVKPIILTFDDGYTDNYKYAFPLLKKYDMVGDFAIITRLMETTSYMSWAQLDEMVKAGNYVSSHTHSHCDFAKKNPDVAARSVIPYLTSPVVEGAEECSGANAYDLLTTAQIRGELRESKRLLESRLGIPIVSLVYPRGAYNAQTIEIAKEEGYYLGFTVLGQSQEKLDLSQSFDIPRYRAFGQNVIGNGFQGFFGGGR